MSSKKITNVIGRMVFDSRGYPTVEAEVQVNKSFYGTSISPSGTSKGKKEAIEKRDSGNDFNGKGVSKVIEIAEENLFPELIGMELGLQEEFDSQLIELDGTKD